MLKLLSTSPILYGLLGCRIGVWLFSYTLYFTMLGAAGLVTGETAIWLVLLAIVGFVLSSATEFFVTRTRRFPVFRRLTILVSAVVLITAVNAVIDVATLGRSLAPGRLHDARFFLINGLQSFAYLVWIHAFYAACAWLVDAYQDLLAKEKRLAEAEMEAQRATLMALRSQINPHFLFNTLNAAASLIATARNRQAEELILKLSDFFRSSLGNDRPAMISLAEELDTLDAYLQIELVRFPGRLDVEIDCPYELTHAILPVFLLLPIVENAIKHAVAPSDTLVHVRIAASGTDGRLTLQVENHAAERVNSSNSQGEGLGLKNVRQRLTAVYGSDASIDASPTSHGFRVCIVFPLVKGEGV